VVLDVSVGAIDGGGGGWAYWMPPPPYATVGMHPISKIRHAFSLLYQPPANGNLQFF